MAKEGKLRVIMQADTGNQRGNANVFQFLKKKKFSELDKME